MSNVPNVAAATGNNPPTFLGLPAELRVRIYEYLAYPQKQAGQGPPGWVLCPQSEHGAGTVPIHATMLACRLCRDEIITDVVTRRLEFLHHSSFVFSNLFELSFVGPRIRAWMLQHIRSIHVEDFFTNLVQHQDFHRRMTFMSGMRNLRALYVTIRGNDPSPSMFLLPRARRWIDTTAATKARWYAAVTDLRNLHNIVPNVEIIVKFRVLAFIQACGDHADGADMGWIDTKLRMRSVYHYMPSTAHTVPEVVSEAEIMTTNGPCVNPTSLPSRVISTILAYAAVEETPLPGQWLVEEGYNLLRPLQLSCRRMRLEVRAEAELLLRTHFLSSNTFRFSDFAELRTVVRFAPVETLAAVERIRIENFTLPGLLST
jgi:hypothetical protein